MLVLSGMTLCQPQSIAYWTDGRRKLLHANFSIVSIPSSLTSALSNYNHKPTLVRFSVSRSKYFSTFYQNEDNRYSQQ